MGKGDNFRAAAANVEQKSIFQGRFVQYAVIIQVSLGLSGQHIYGESGYHKNLIHCFLCILNIAQRGGRKDVCFCNAVKQGDQ